MNPQEEIYWGCTYCEKSIKKYEENYAVLSRTIDGVKRYGVVHENCYTPFMISFEKPSLEGFFKYAKEEIKNEV